MEDANEARQSVSDLNKYVDGAFSDGIISGAEAKAIEKYLNTVSQSRKEMDATYTSLYVNPFLSGAPKSALYAAKNSLNTATTNLTAAIQSAISDGKTTVTEKEIVDSKFSAFNNACASLATAIENANKAIQQKIKEELYLYLLNKREENALTMVITESNSRTIDNAFGSSNPLFPNKSMILAIAILFCLAIPFLIIYMLEILDTTIRGRKDIEDKLSCLLYTSDAADD